MYERTEHYGEVYHTFFTDDGRKAHVISLLEVSKGEYKVMSSTCLPTRNFEPYLKAYHQAHTLVVANQQSTYRLDENACGGSLQGYFRASYTQLVALLGEPNSVGDGYKVSTQWSLVGPDGVEISLYDYKETHLYDDEYITVDQFRALESYEWHIGAGSKQEAERFTEWLTAELDKK